MGMPSCFDCGWPASSSSDYLDGRWMLRNGGGDEGSYRLAHALRKAVDLSSNSNADLCYDQQLLDDNAQLVHVPKSRALQLPGRNGRTGYEWTPSRCSLAKFPTTNGCSALSRKFILFVGDSVLLQIFLSFALQLNARFPLRAFGLRTDHLIDANTSLEDHGVVKLRFIRNDLLTEVRPRAHPSCICFNRTQQLCDVTMSAAQRVVESTTGHHKCRYPSRIRGPAFKRSSALRFMDTALSADAVVLGTGHHFHDAGGRPYWQSHRMVRAQLPVSLHNRQAALLLFSFRP